MHTRDYDERTIERWRLEPRWPALEFKEVILVEEAPPLWKDLAFGSAVAVVLWLAAAVVFG